jgi:hypothetical protein
MGTGLNRQWQQLLLAAQLERQRGICPVCTLRLSKLQAVLDRFDPTGNFTPANVRALHFDCEAMVLRRRAAARTAIPMMEAAE